MPLARTTVLLLIVALAAACTEPPAEMPEDVVAQVGGQRLTEQEVDASLRDLPLHGDTAQARRQLIERWVTNELLFQEAQRRGLREQPEVERLLRENERSVLVSALVSALFDEAPMQPTPAEVRAYYERNRDRLALREPYVRVRHLATTVADSAAAARRLLQQAVRRGEADERWPELARRFAREPDVALELGGHYYPEQRLFADRPALRSLIGRLGPGEIAPVQDHDSLYHLVQLVDRAPVGSTPELAWVEDELRQRLVVQTRKQMYARQVERLRNEAQSRGALSVR